MKFLKTTTLSFACLIFFFPSEVQSQQSLTEQKLKGKINTLTETKYTAVEKFGELQKDKLHSKYTFKYDTMGNLLEMKRHNPNGSMDRIENYKYDVKGKKTEESITGSPGQNINTKTTYNYDENGNMVEYNYYDNGKLWWKIKSKFDDKGNKIEDNTYNSDGNLTEKVKYKYDEKNNVNEKNQYYSDGSLGSKTIFKYDANGNKTEENRYNSNGSLSEKNTYKYNEKGIVIERNGNNANDRWSYIFDDTGNNIDESHFNNSGQMTYRVINKYDDNGNNTEYYRYNSNGKIDNKSITKYENIDKSLNWLNSIYIVNGKPWLISERIIEYY